MDNQKIEDSEEFNDKDSYCHACGDKLSNYSILLCFTCLDVDCSEFFEKSKNLEEE